MKRSRFIVALLSLTISLLSSSCSDATGPGATSLSGTWSGLEDDGSTWTFTIVDSDGSLSGSYTNRTESGGEIDGTLVGTFTNPNVRLSLEGILFEGMYTGRVNRNTITGTINYSILGIPFTSELVLTRG